MNLLKGILASFSIGLTTIAVYVPLTWWIIRRTWSKGTTLSRLKQRMDKIILWWTNSNRHMINTLNLSDVTVNWHEKDEMSPDKWYLVISNHQSWTDIVLLQSYLYGTIPPLKFFTKDQLIWVPFIGLAMYVLGFPYVKRVTKAQIKANPKLRTADRDNVAAACEGFKNHPTTILNFVEGTRFTPEKHTRQRNEYRHLLRPKVGGLGYVLEDMDQYLHRLIDVTIIYPDGTPSFWDFLQGKCPRVHMEIIPHVIPDEILHADEAERRAALGQWIKTIWLAKDERIDQRLTSST
jgi:1-acyl-sn-glycerol-3-phosphate acyltransferase